MFIFYPGGQKTQEWNRLTDRVAGVIDCLCAAKSGVTQNALQRGKIGVDIAEKCNLYFCIFFSLSFCLVAAVCSLIAS
jgi:hypothetical protein